jgi:hypothetical protein
MKFLMYVYSELFHVILSLDFSFFPCSLYYVRDLVSFSHDKIRFSVVESTSIKSKINVPPYHVIFF